MSYGLWHNPLHNPQPSKPARLPAQQSPNQPPTQRADFHFLYLAPGVGIEYFFSASKLYWQTFKTVVTFDLSLIDLVPAQYSVAITSLSRSDTAELVRDQIANNIVRNVYHDPLVYDFIEDVQLTLDARADRNEPYGVPLDS